MCPKDVDGMANSVDPDQTAPGSTLFAQTCLSENLGSLRYLIKVMMMMVMMMMMNFYTDFYNSCNQGISQ